MSEPVAQGHSPAPTAAAEPPLLPPGTRLALGEAIIEVTEPPHTACKKFAARFGTEAVVFVNSGLGKTQNFRGICAKVVQSGDIHVGDIARKA